jgi:hypothetical protein
VSLQNGGWTTTEPNRWLSYKRIEEAGDKLHQIGLAIGANLS